MSNRYKIMRQIHNLKQTKYARLSERIEDMIKDNGMPTKRDEVLKEWVGVDVAGLDAMIAGWQNFFPKLKETKCNYSSVRR